MLINAVSCVYNLDMKPYTPLFLVLTLQLVEGPQTIEQRAIAAAAPMDAKRFSVIINTGTDVDDSPNVTAGEKVGFELLFESTRHSHMLICNFLIL